MNIVMDLDLIIWSTVGTVVLAVLLVTAAVVLRIISKSRGPLIPTSKDNPLPSVAKSDSNVEPSAPENVASRVTRLRSKLANSANPFGRALFNILSKDNLSEDDWQDVEDTLLMADVGAQASDELVESLRKDARISGTASAQDVREILRAKLLDIVGAKTDRSLNADSSKAHKPSVIMMVGVNGTGKTTTAGKLARLMVSKNRSVILAAADTFRAAAADQLETWANVVGVKIVRSEKDGAKFAELLKKLFL